jgi:uncharacterized protein YhaN
MIIKRVHIDKFGKFDDYTIDFGDRCNVVYGSNEDGKSTVMNFVKMMFYGNPGRSGDISKNVRKRYQPWNGAKMSGYIVFESKGTPYKLIRSFGNTNSTDKITLWNLASGEEESLPMKTEPGLKFLGIGAAAFEKSVFIGQIGSLEDATFENDKDDEINQKLLNLVSTGDETVSYKKVDARLQNAKDSLRAKRGKIGTIDKLQQALVDLTGEFNVAKAEEEEKRSLEKRISDIRLQIGSAASQVEAVKLGIELQELLSMLEGQKRLIEKISKADELSKDFKAKAADLESRGIDLDGVFEEKCEEAIDSRKAAIELYEERLRAIEGKKATLDKLKSFEYPLIPDELVDEVRLMETESDEISKEISVFKDKVNAAVGFLERKKAVDEIVESLKQNSGLLEKAKAANAAAESRLDLARATLGDSKARLDEVERNLEESEVKLNQARSDYRIAQQNTSGIRSLNETRIEAARERVRQAETPRKFSTQETKPAKPGIALILIALALAAASVFLGMTENLMFYGGVAISAVILVVAFSRKETVTKTTSEVDEEELKLAKAGLEELALQTKQLFDRASEDEEKVRKDSELLEAEYKVLYERFAEAKRLHAQASDEFSLSEKAVNETGFSLKHLLEADDSMNKRLAEKESELNQLGFTASKEELDSLNLELAAKSRRLEEIGKGLEEKLGRFGCRTSDEIKSLHLESRNSRKSIDEKEKEISEASLEVEAARVRIEESTSGFLELISRYSAVNGFEEGLALFSGMKVEFERLSEVRLKAENQKELISGELAGRTAADVEVEARRITDEILEKNGGVLPLKMSEHGIEVLKAEARELQDKERSLEGELIRTEAEVSNRFKDKRNISQVEDEIEKLKDEIKAADDYYDTLGIAQEVMTSSFNEIRQSFGPLLNTKTADIFSSLTGGRYKNVMITRNFDINVQDSSSSEMREWKYLSSGTVDQAYLSLRLAVSDLLNRSNEELPVLLDDVFIQYDDERARKGLEFLVGYSNGGESSPQVILFTCHRRIVDWAENGVTDISVRYLA